MIYQYYDLLCDDDKEGINEDNDSNSNSTSTSSGTGACTRLVALVKSNQVKNILVQMVNMRTKKTTRATIILLIISIYNQHSVITFLQYTQSSEYQGPIPLHGP